jgi:hypothetical protein
VLVVALAIGAGARAQSIMPLAEVRPGMQGYGLTVFRGERPERFDIEVIDVLHQFLPRQDVILIRMGHPLLERVGTVGGMSGSPIFIEGKLVGALAYGWLYAMDPIAGVTPIENMLEDLSRPLRPVPVWARTPLPLPQTTSNERAQEGASRRSPPRGFWAHFHGGLGLAPATTPLLVAGFSARVRRLLSDLLGDHGFIPLEAGGSGPARATAEAPRPFEPGGALGVQLVRGDLSVTGIGTVTTQRGSQVLAFGHPFFEGGQQLYPVTTARVVTILASRRRSVKFGEPLAEAGALIQDRQSCIIADTNRRSPMTEVDIDLRDRTTGRQEHFAVHVVREPFLLPALTWTSVLALVDRFASDRQDVTLALQTRFHVAGHGTLSLADQAVLPRGAGDASALLAMQPFGALGRIVTNPFEPVTVERIEVDLDLDFRRDQVEIVGAYVVGERLVAGQPARVQVVVRAFGGGEQVHGLDVPIPATAAGQRLELAIAGGAEARPPRPAPYSLGDLLRNLQRRYPATSLVATLHRYRPGVTLRGHVAQDLPPSALDAFRPLAVDAQEQEMQTVDHVELSLGRVVVGQARLQLEVDDVRQ